MSLSGSVERSLTILGVQWKRHLDEYEGVLSPGWTVAVTIPFAKVTFQDFGWEAKHRLTRRPTWIRGTLYLLGGAIHFETDPGAFALQKHSDAEMLLTKAQQEWRDKHVINDSGWLDEGNSTAIYIACKCGVSVTGEHGDGIEQLEDALSELHEAG